VDDAVLVLLTFLRYRLDCGLLLRKLVVVMLCEGFDA